MLGKECGQCAIVAAVSGQVDLPSGDLRPVELILGEELPIWGLVVLVRVYKIL